MINDNKKYKFTLIFKVEKWTKIKSKHKGYLKLFVKTVHNQKKFKIIARNMLHKLKEFQN